MENGLRRREFTRAVLSTAIAAAAAQAPFAAGGAAAKAGLLEVVATTGMIADTARQIGGESVRVRALMGPGVDPHAYRQTRSDVVALSRADMVLWHGLYLEAQLEELMLKLARHRRVIAVAEALPRERLLAHEDYAHKFDPHVWMDPMRWKTVAERIREVLAEARPEEAEAFSERTQGFLAELDALDAYSRGALATVPEENRILLTAHDAFNYFGDAYGIEVIGVQGISTESEAGVARISQLVDLLVERRAPAVFVESSVSDRNVRALIEGAAARGHQLAIGGELFSDAMGAVGSYEGTYLGMIDHNVTTIARALGGSPPQKGRIGRLGEKASG